MNKNYQFFLENVKELEKQHKGKFVVIKDSKILDFYDDFACAVRKTIEQGHKPGTFSVQEVNSTPNLCTIL